MSRLDVLSNAFAVSSWLPIGMLVAKATVLLVVALALTLLMQRTSAVSRHLVWVVSLGALLVVPLVAAITPWRLPVLPAFTQLLPLQPDRVVLTRPSVTSTPGVSVRATDANGAPLFVRTAPSPTVPNASVREVRNASSALMQQDIIGPNDVAAPLSAARSGWPRIAIVLCLAWGGVTLALTVWLLVGTVLVRRIVRRALPMSDARWQATLHEIADRLGMDVVPRLVRTDAVTMPFACGMRTPTIVLPMSADAWSGERRAAVLLHELAHIKRHDMVAHTLSRLVCAAYWFHPLVWTAARKLRAESERACDDLALLSGIRASDYAEHLLDIVTSVRHHRAPALALAMATRGEFEGRMLAILDPERKREGPGRAQSVLLVGGGVLVAALLGVITPASSLANEVRHVASHGQAKVAASMPLAHSASDTITVRRGLDALDDAALETRRRVIDSTQALLQSLQSRVYGGRGVSNPTDTASIAAAAQRSAIGARAAQAALPVGLQLSQLIFSGMSKGISEAQAELSKPKTPSVKPDTSERAALLAKVLRTNETTELRRISAWGLMQFATQPVAFHALIESLQGEDAWTVREMAAWSLSASYGNDVAIRALAKAAVDEKDVPVRETAVWALVSIARTGDPTAVSAFEHAYASADAGVRETAVWGLGTRARATASIVLRMALVDNDSHVRTTAAWALKQIGDSNTVPWLDAALRKESNSDVQYAMLRALASMDDAALPTISRLVDDRDPAIRALAIRSLAGASLHDPWPQPRPRPRPRP